jgi:hypothetical protein
MSNQRAVVSDARLPESSVITIFGLEQTVVLISTRHFDVGVVLTFGVYVFLWSVEAINSRVLTVNQGIMANVGILKSV